MKEKLGLCFYTERLRVLHISVLYEAGINECVPGAWVPNKGKAGFGKKCEGYLHFHHKIN